MSDLRYCKACFAKQQIINKLTVENERLKARLYARERSAREGPFGSSTPSSKIPIKPDTLDERQARCGGLNRGHVGHGRRGISEEAADRVERITLDRATCPDCGEITEHQATADHDEWDTFECKECGNKRTYRTG